MDYVYYLSNASLVLRVVERLHRLTQLPLEFVSVIHRIDGWIVRIRLHESVAADTASNFQAFLDEVGGRSTPGYRIRMALWGLETGQTPVDVMRRYQVAVVSHGKPDSYEIEEFRKQFVEGLGYCPETLA